MSLYQQQREKVAQSILNTSIDLFRKHGYEKTTIDMITQEVGVAKGTFYNFFVSKRDVLMKWAAQVFKRLDFRSAFSAQRNFEHNMFVMVRLLSSYIKEDYVLFAGFLKELFAEQGLSEEASSFDFAGIMSQIADSSSDREKFSGTDGVLKISILSDSLFMGIIRWFNKHSLCDGLETYLLDIVRICFHGFLDPMEG